MHNLLYIIERNKLSRHTLDTSTSRVHNLSEPISKPSNLRYLLDSYEKLAIEDGIVFLKKVVSGYNPINGGCFEEGSFYRNSNVKYRLDDICELFEETEGVNYVRFSEASALLSAIYNSIIPVDPYAPDRVNVGNDFYDNKAREVFLEIRNLLAKHCLPIIVHHHNN